MTAPRLERIDLLIMDAYPGEHYPVEVDVSVGSYDEATGEKGPIVASERQLRCGCTDDLGSDWGAAPHL